MKYSPFVALASALLPLAYGVRLSYDQTYDNPSASLSSTACSDGDHGLVTRGYTTFSSLPSFPLIGGAPDITQWNSPACGTCYELTYTEPKTGKKTSVDIIGVDVAKGGFNVAKAAMERLVGAGRAEAVGVINVDVAVVQPSKCGFK